MAWVTANKTSTCGFTNYGFSMFFVLLLNIPVHNKAAAPA
jgi:hypothetical protein